MHPTYFDLQSESIPRRVTTGLSKIGLALRTHAWQGAQGRSLTPTQGQILALLRSRGGPLRLTEAALEIGITQATASEAVATLVEKKLVRKSPSPADGRAVALTLTEAGRREAERAAEWPDFLLGAVEVMTPDEQAVFLRGLIKMIRALQERGEIPVARMCVNCRFFRPRVHADPVRPHHCAFVDAPFGDHQLRVECGEQQPASAGEAATNWQQFISVDRLKRPGPRRERTPKGGPG